MYNRNDRKLVENGVLFCPLKCVEGIAEGV